MHILCKPFVKGGRCAGQPSSAPSLALSRLGPQEPAESAGKKPRREPSPRRHNPPPRRHSPPASQPPSSGAGNSLILGHVRPNVPSNQHMSSTQLSIIERLQDSVREQLAGKVPEVFIQGLLKAVDLHGSMQTLEKMHRYGETIVIVPTLRNIRIEFLRLKVREGSRGSAEQLVHSPSTVGHLRPSWPPFSLHSSAVFFRIPPVPLSVAQGHLDRTIGYDYYLFLTKLPQTIILVGIVNGRTDLSVGLADALRTAPVMDVTALDFRGMITANIRRGDGSGAAPR